MKQNCIGPLTVGKSGVSDKPIKVFRQGACFANIFFNTTQVNGAIVEIEKRKRGSQFCPHCGKEL